MTVSISYNNNTNMCVMRMPDGDLLKTIRNKFSVANEFASFQSPFAPRKLYAITPGGKFEPGLIFDVMAAFREISDDIIISLDDNLKGMLEKAFKTDEVKVIDNDLDLRYYQKDIIHKALNAGRGICVLGTGGGKTLAIATLIHNILLQDQSLKIFIVVPDRGLVSQTYDDFNEYKVPFTFSKWTFHDALDTSSSVIIANSSIINARFDSESWWINGMDVVIVDECHKLNTKSETGKIIKGIDTCNKFGFTGTLPPKPQDVWSVTGKIGPVFFEKGSDELREEGFLVSAEVKVLKVTYKKQPSRLTGDLLPSARYRHELNFIYNNQFRNKLIYTLCKNFTQNILILVNHIEHGAILADTISSLTDRMVYFVQGAVEFDEREHIKKMIESNNNVICIAMTSIFSTGINIKNIHMILLGHAGKAFIRLVQSIGRGLRLHKSKDKLLIVDIADNLPYGYSHVQKRLDIYTKEKIPFTVNVINEKL